MSSSPRYTPHYTVEDYQHWPGDWELCSGTAVAMTPSPFGRHAKLLVNLAAVLKSSIDLANCHATVLAEIDWVISDDTVLRPDLIVVCGDEPERHVVQTPAIVVEILSESTRDRDLNYKRDVYEQQNLPYYLIVDPNASELTVLRSDKGTFVESEFSDTLTLEFCGDCQIRLSIESMLH